MKEPRMEYLCEELRPFLKEVLLQNVGIAEEKYELLEVLSCQPIICKRRGCSVGGDHFKLLVPYAGQALKWDIIFNASRAAEPPDFFMSDDGFLESITVDSLASTLPSLANWDPNDGAALYRVLTELRAMYEGYQLDTMKHVGHSRCTHEYFALRGDEGNGSAVEVLVADGFVHFLIRLTLVLDHLTLPKHSREYTACLSVTFSSMGLLSLPRLLMSSAMKEIIPPDIKLPHLPPGEDSLSEYVPTIEKKLEDQVRMYVEACQMKRKLFLFELVSRLHGAVLQYDTSAYMQASFLLNNDGFHYMLCVAIPRHFPHSPPSYTMQSIYTHDSQRAFTAPLLQVPYSATWSRGMMVENALKQLKKQIPQFQSLTLKKFKLPRVDGEASRTVHGDNAAM